MNVAAPTRLRINRKVMWCKASPPNLMLVAPDPRPNRTSTRIQRILIGGLLCGLILLPSPPSLAQARSGWKPEGTEHGVAISQLPDANRTVPIFKGVLTIDAPLYHLLGILCDIPRYPEWNSRLGEVRILERRSDFDLQFYLQLLAPWPVSDRDAALQSFVRPEANGERITAWVLALPESKVPVPARFVRFTQLRITYTLERLNPTRTRVEYTIDADPGGWLPGWLVRHSIKFMPVDALVGMTRQAQRTQGTYDDFIRRHDPTQGSKVQ